MTYFILVQDPHTRPSSRHLSAMRLDIATLINDAILAVERDNPAIKGRLPRLLSGSIRLEEVSSQTGTVPHLPAGGTAPTCQA